MSILDSIKRWLGFDNEQIIVYQQTKVHRYENGTFYGCVENIKHWKCNVDDKTARCILSGKVWKYKDGDFAMRYYVFDEKGNGKMIFRFYEDDGTFRDKDSIGEGHYVVEKGKLIFKGIEGFNGEEDQTFYLAYMEKDRIIAGYEIIGTYDDGTEEPDYYEEEWTPVSPDTPDYKYAIETKQL